MMRRATLSPLTPQSFCRQLSRHFIAFSHYDAILRCALYLFTPYYAAAALERLPPMMFDAIYSLFADAAICHALIRQMLIMLSIFAIIFAAAR